MFIINTPSGSVTVRDHRPLIQYLEERGIDHQDLDDINFFQWAALPEVSYGKFLVWEGDWKYNDCDGSQITSLVIQDGLDEVTFDNLFLSDVTAVQSTLDLSDIDSDPEMDDDDEIKSETVTGRLLIITLTLDRFLNHPLQAGVRGLGPEDGKVTIDDTDSDYEEYRPSKEGIFPQFANKEQELPVMHTLEKPIDLYMAYFAHVHFATAYYSRTGNTDTLPTVTNELTDFRSLRLLPLIHNQSRSTSKGIKFNFYYRDHMYRIADSEGEEYRSANQTMLPDQEDYFYISRPEDESPLVEFVNFYYPFWIVDTTDEAYQDTLDTIATSALGNAQTRFQRNLNLLYLGVVDTVINNDVQEITYRLEDIGFTTRLKTIPWKLWNPYNIPNPRITITDVVYVTSEDKDEYGFYDGTIQRYDIETQTWIDMGPCKVLDANDPA